MTDSLTNTRQTHVRTAEAVGVGPLLYIPGLREDICEKIVRFSAYSPLSAALCLEDTVSDDMVGAAEANVVCQLRQLSEEAHDRLPSIFIRVREPEQIYRLTEALGSGAELVKGFILPKIDDTEFGRYISIIRSSDKLFMPIIENPSLLEISRRAERLAALKEMTDSVSSRILNIRVGGNDFSGALGVRSGIGQSVYDIYPVMNLLSDISAEFSSDYVVSAPVWNYFAGECGDDRWEKGMAAEIERDKLMGFIGKTVIHPSQISVYNRCMKVSAYDYKDALLLRNTANNHLRVIKGTEGTRMCEHNVHMKWAENILALAQVYGVEGEQ